MFKDVASFYNPNESNGSIEYIRKRDDSILTTSSTGITCHGVEPILFLGYSDQGGYMADMLTKWQCAVCNCIPFPDEVVQCSACDSLFCSIKSIELKTSCPHCEL